MRHLLIFIFFLIPFSICQSYVFGQSIKATGNDSNVEKKGYWVHTYLSRDLKVRANPDVAFSSTFTAAIPEALPGLEFDSNYFSAINVSGLKLLRYVYGLQRTYGQEGGNLQAFYDPGRTILNINDSALENRLRLVPIDSDWKPDRETSIEWNKKNGICYEMSVPVGTSILQKWRYIMDDLKRYFAALYHVEFSLQERKIVKLVAIDSSLNMKTSGDKSVEKYEDSEIFVSNIPFQRVVDHFRKLYNRKFSFFSNVRFSGNVDMALHGSIFNFEAINRELKKYGIGLIVSELPKDVLVVTEIQ